MEQTRTPPAVYDRLREKVVRDRVFLLASALTFNVLVAIVPLLLVTIAGLGVAIESSTLARERILLLIGRAIPAGERVEVEQLLFTLIGDRGWIGLVGVVGLVWASTRLFTSLRDILQIVLEIPVEERYGVVRGKLHDAGMVAIAGTLFVLTVGITSILRWIEAYGIRLLGLAPAAVDWATSAASVGIAFAITWSMFFVVYRYAPDRNTSIFDAAVAATFGSVLFEIAKHAFVAYLAHFDRFTQVYGSFAGLAAVAVWAYYGSLVFVLGAEIAGARRWAADRASIDDVR